MLTDPAVTSITIGFALSPHDRRSASRTPRRESATSNATRTRPHTATAETSRYYASLLIRHGESVKTVQSRLGHASAVETLDTYSHLWPDSDDRTRDAIDSVLGFTADALRMEADPTS